MNNIQNHCANGREYLLIPIPEGDFELIRNQDNPNIQQIQLPTDLFRGHLQNYESFDLPPGNWSIVGKASELSEQQASELVERHEYIHDNNACYYHNYDLPFGLPTAKESLSSLLSSLGMGEGNTLILKRQ